MIPTRAQCLIIQDRYNLPSVKKIHVEMVARVAMWMAEKLKQRGENINLSLVEAAALLHDIDKNIRRLPGEKHPETAVRVVREMGLEEVAQVIKAHPLHAILDPATAPKSWEEKAVYLADKMTKYEIIGVDHRFKMWYAEKMGPEADKILDAAYPKVKQLEKEIFTLIGSTYTEMKRELG